MKKTLITLLALGGIAMGETAGTTTLIPLTDDAWTLGKFNSGKTTTWTHSAADGTLVLDKSDWSRAYATYTFDAPLAAAVNQPITFSFYVTRGDATNAIFSFALKGSNKVVVLGTKDYGNTDLYFGTSTDTTGNAYYFTKQTGPITIGANDQELMLAGCLATTTTITGSAVLNASGETVLTLTANSVATKEINLGKDFNFVGLSFYGDGQGNGTNWTISVPEPTTATLSLLALAGLAARRRRR